MKSVIIQAKTIDAAVEEALEKLGCSYGDFDVEVIENGGIFKKGKFKFTLKADEVVAETKKSEPVKDAVKVEKEVEVRKEEKKESELPKFEKGVKSDSDVVVKFGESTKLDACVRFVKGLVEGIGYDVQVDVTTTDRAYTIEIKGDDVGRLIGKGGDALNALQVLVSSVAISNANGDGKRVYVNIENYKERREETLKSLANKKAEFVRSTGKSAKLENMSPRDRAIIHNVISGLEGVRSYSIGEGNGRRLVIAPKKEDAKKDVTTVAKSDDAKSED